MSSCTFSERVRAMRIGQVETRTIRVPLADNHLLQTEVAGMVRTVNSTVSRLRTKTGSEFRVETSSSVTTDSTAILAHVSVTCLAGGTTDVIEDDDDI